MWINKKKWKDINDKLQTANDKITKLEKRIEKQNEEYNKIVYLHGEANPKVEPCMSMACVDCKYAVIDYGYNWYDLQGCGKNRFCEHFEKRSFR